MDYIPRTAQCQRIGFLPFGYLRSCWLYLVDVVVGLVERRYKHTRDLPTLVFHKRIGQREVELRAVPIGEYDCLHEGDRLYVGLQEGVPVAVCRNHINHDIENQLSRLS